MPLIRGPISRLLPILFFIVAAFSASAQSGSAGAIHGTVTDPSGAVIPNATVHLTNPTSGLDRTATTDGPGQFAFANVPFNPYKISASASGFSPASQDFDLRSVVGTTLKLVLQVATANQTVTVEAQGDLIENDPTFHTDVDRDMFITVPMESASSGSAPWSRSPPPAFLPTPTVSFTAWAIMLRIPSRWMGSRSPTSRARSSPTSFRPIRFSPWK